MEAPGHVPSVPSPKSGTAGGCTCDVVCIIRTYISEVFSFTLSLVIMIFMFFQSATPSSSSTLTSS